MSPAERREAVLARQRFVLGLRSRRRPTRRPVPRMRLPDAARNEYARELTTLLRQLEMEVMRELGTELENLVRRNDLTRNDAQRTDDVPDDVSSVIGKLRAASNRLFDAAGLRSLALRIGSAVSATNKTEVQRQVLSVLKVDVLGAEPYLRAQFAAFVQENVSLIQSVPDALLRDVEGVVLRGLRKGTRASAIASEMQARFGMSRSKALLIARDQVGKFNGELTQLRHQEIGVTEYIWRTSNDERVRPAHEERNGKRFQWSSPPDDGHPGEAVQCRCTAEPVLDMFLPSERRPS